MKKLFTLFVSLWIAMVSLFAVNMTGGEKLYLTPNSNWTQANARFAAYFFGTGEAWASLTAVTGETDLYEVTVPNGNWTNVIFCRMNPSQTANNWNNKWNQTSDLIFDGTKNRYTIASGAWDKGGGTWSLYSTEPIITVVSSPEFPATTVDETVDATLKYTIANSSDKATITIDDAAFTAVDADGTVTITFAPTEAKEYSATLTIAVGTVKQTVTLSAVGLAKDAPKEPEVLNLTTPNFDAIIEGNVTTAVATYELLNAEEVEAKVEGEGFEITEQSKGNVTIKFAPTEAGEYTGTLFILVAGETLKQVAFTATAKPSPYYAIRGTMTDWAAANDIKLTANDDKSEYFIQGFEITSGAKFKVVYVSEDDVTTWYGTDKVQLGTGISNGGTGEGDIELTPAGKYDIYYKVKEGKIWIQKYVESTPEPEPIDPYAAIRGLGEGTEEEAWSEAAQIKLELNAEAEGEEWFIQGLEIAEGKAFKVVYVNAKSETAWYGAGAVEANEYLGKFGEGEDNITLAAGKYDIYFKVASGTMWIAPVKEEEPEPADPIINVIVADFTNNTTEVGDRADAAIVYSLENAESATVNIEGEYVTFEQTDVEEGYMIGIFFTPEQVGEFPGKVIITAGEVTKEVEFTFIATEPEGDDDDEEEAELEFALVGRLNGSDDEILAFEDGYKFTKESEFVYTVNVTFTGAAVSGNNNVQKVKLVDAEGNIWARNKSSKTIYTSDTQGKDITSTMTLGETASSTYLVTEIGVEYKITYTLVSDPAEALYKQSGQITFEKVESSDEGGEEGDDEGEEPSNEITFTVVVPEGTVECWIAGTGTPAWTFIQMEAVEGEANMFTLTTTLDVLDGEQWKYSSGNDWAYCEKNDGGGNRTDAGDPDVVTAWEKLYDPNAQPIEPYYGIRGTMTGWTDAANDIKLTENAEGTEWYITSFEIAEADEFKVVYVDAAGSPTWYGAGAVEANEALGKFGEGEENIKLAAGKYDIYFKVDTKTMWIQPASPSTDAEEAIAELIYAIDGTIYAPAPFAIIDLAGKDVTKANGALEGTYIVQTQNSVTKVLVK